MTDARLHVWADFQPKRPVDYVRIVEREPWWRRAGALLFACVAVVWLVAGLPVP